MSSSMRAPAGQRPTNGCNPTQPGSSRAEAEDTLARRHRAPVIYSCSGSFKDRFAEATLTGVMSATGSGVRGWTVGKRSSDGRRQIQFAPVTEAPPFGPTRPAPTNDCLLPLRVSTPDSDHRPQPLQSCRPRPDCRLKTGCGRSSRVDLLAPSTHCRRSRSRIARSKAAVEQRKDKR